MATRTRGTSMGLVYGLVIFVILFVVATALAILFYSRTTKATETAAEANDRVAQLATQTEQGTEFFNELLAQQQSTGTTIYGQLVQQRRTLLQDFVGEGVSSPAMALQRLRALGVPAGRGALAEIATLKSTIEAKEATVAEMERNREQRVNQYAELSQQFKELAANHVTEMQARSAELQSLRDDLAALQTRTNASLDEQVKTHEQARQRMQEEVRAKQAEVVSKQTEIDRLTARIREMQAQFGQFMLEGPRVELEADGVISAVFPQENLAYIDLGQKDRVILGMRFEVFDQAKGVVLEASRGAGRVRNLRGKATIEVVRMTDHTSTCRIVRQDYGTQVTVGDLITNIVYDKARTFKFFVYGDYDLDQDNQYTLAEFEQVLGLIQQWGGEAIEDMKDLPLDTDFLVLGREPQMPRPIDPNETDPIIITKYQQDLQAVKDYQRLAAQAAGLSIPVLNQNRFLTLVGYFNR
jgi:hypothetical protein